MRWDRRRWIVLCAALSACQGPEDGADDGVATDGFPQGPVVRSAVTPPPISGGTLLLIEDDRLAVAADPDRDLVYVVDLYEEQQLHAIALEPGDEPGRLAVDAAGQVHVIARRGGVVIDLDARGAAITGRRAVCPNPRGIAYDPQGDALHVACAGGDLMTLPASGGPPTRRVKVAPDLRDVLLTPEGLAVTRFREAAVLRLDADGAIVEDQRVRTMQRTLDEFGTHTIDHLKSNTAWRTLAMPNGEWLMLHQVSTARPLEVEPIPDDDPPEGAEGGGEGGGYGGSSHDPELGCDGAVHPLLTMANDVLLARSSPLLHGVVLPVDAALSPDGEHVVLAVAGKRSDQLGQAGVVMVPTSSFTSRLDPGCESPPDFPLPPGQYTAVTVDWHGMIIAQSRSPAQLVRIDPRVPEAYEVIALDGAARRDTGHDLFHLDAGAGISCATCHPEGGDDGHLWHFAGLGRRHTPALTFGLEGTEPFHWQGEFEDTRQLADAIHTARMGGARLSDERVETLESYLYSIPVPPPMRSRNDASATRGADLFAAWGCGSCHTGPALAINDNVELGFEYTLQVPGLRGVALHPPYMHDGRAPDLQAAVLDMLTRTRPGQPTPGDAAVDDVVAYLESL